MPSNYPGGYDNFDEDHADEPSRRVGPDLDQLAAGVNALQYALGLNPLSGGSGGAAAPNIVQAKQTSDFTVSGTVATMTQLGTIEPSITIAAGSRVRVRVSGVAGYDATPITMRASIDSGASFLLLGRRNLAPEGGSLDSEEIVSGLSAGAHTVKLEFTKGGTGILYIRGASQPTLERLVIILEEIV